MVRTASAQGSIWHGLFGVKGRKENTAIHIFEVNYG
jgi:hypothetical protein